MAEVPKIQSIDYIDGQVVHCRQALVEKAGNSWLALWRGLADPPLVHPHTEMGMDMIGHDLNDQVWLPVWSNLQMASKVCNELIKCAGLVKVAMVRSHTGIAQTQIFAIVNVTDNVIIRESETYSARFFNVSDC